MNQDNKEQKPQAFMVNDKWFILCGCGRKLSIDRYLCPSCGNINRSPEAIAKEEESARKRSIPMKPQKPQVFTDDGKFFFCECGAKVSVDAISCPSCGDMKTKEKAIQRQTGRIVFHPVYENEEEKTDIVWWKVVGTILLIIFVWQYWSGKWNSSDSSKPPYACQFSDGAVLYGIRSSVKERLNNPDSFEFISSEKIGEGKYQIYFRGENAFGAIIIKSAFVTVTKDCHPLSVRFL